MKVKYLLSRAPEGDVSPIMGGTIHMASPPESSSHFKVTLPLMECQWVNSPLAGSEWWEFSREPERYSYLQKMGAVLKPINKEEELKNIKGLLLADEDLLESFFPGDRIYQLESRPVRRIVFSSHTPLCKQIILDRWWSLGTSPLYPDLLVDTCQRLLPTSNKPAIYPPPSTLSGCILVADDHQVNRELLYHQLTILGLDVVCVNNGEQALQACARQQFDLLLTDLHMPAMDGYTLNTTLRHRQINVPIIAVTANVSKNTHNHILATGFNDVLIKPYSIESLYRLLCQWLSEPSPLNKHIPNIWSSLFGDNYFARSMANAYIRTCEKDCASLYQALTSNNTEELSAIAHRMKGAACIVSHTELETKVAYLENIATTAKQETLQAVVQSIITESENYARQMERCFHE